MTELNRRLHAPESSWGLTTSQPLTADRHEIRHLRLRRGKRAVAALAATGLLLTVGTTALAATQITVTNAGGLTAAGPVNSDNGFPAWYGDKSNVRLEQCLDQDNPLCGLIAGTVPDPNIPVSFPDNFPGEFFYQSVGGTLTLPGGGKATLTLGLEGAFTNGVAVQGDQVVFARSRVFVKGGPKDTTVTLKYPFGQMTIDTDATGAGRLTQDISPSVGNFTAALKGNFGPFLTWDPAVAPAAPAGYVGDPGIAHAVVGSPIGYNGFSLTAPGVSVETTDLNISGKIATNTGVTVDKAVANGGFLDVFATSQGSQLQVDGVSGSYATTPMTNDPGSQSHYARIAFTGAKPTSVSVSNLGDKPLSNAKVKLADVSVTQADYDGTNLTVAATGDSYPLTVVGIGDLADNTPTPFALAAPPATISVKSAGGAPVSYPVTITGGPVTPAGEAPIAPAPDTGPVIDQTPNNAVTPVTASVAPVTVPVQLGGTVTLDGSASTGAATYAWTQTSGPTATVTAGAGTSKLTVKLPFFTSTLASSPSANLAPITFSLVATNAAGTASTPSTVTIPVKTDTLTIAATAKHRVGTELRVDGTSLIDGVAGVLTPPTSVVIWNTSGATPVKLGTSPVDTLGAWTLRLKPGPSVQVRTVLVQSTRGSTGTTTLLTK